MDGKWTHSRWSRVLGDWSGDEAEALFRRLSVRIRTQIQTGQIPAGVKLPSERALATTLGVSRSTVVAALNELRSDGLIVSRHGSGTFVTIAGVHRRARGESRLDGFAEHAGSDGPIDLRSAALPGLPFVVDQAADLDWSRLGASVSTHGYFPGGLGELREAVATYFEDLGLPTTASQILITSGAQQALRLLITTLLEPGAAVLAEEPTFRGAIETMRSQGVRISPVASGPDGIDLHALERAIRVSRARMLFVQASGHNPTGATLDIGRRRTLLRLAEKHSVIVVEDAAVADTATTGDVLPPLAAYSNSSITIGSASKLFWGGLRVGWLRAGADLVRELASMKGAEDLGTSVPGQLLTAELMGRVPEARALRRAALVESRDVVLDTLGEVLPEWRCAPPKAGASAWVQLPRGSATTLAQIAARNGVLVLPGPTFSNVDGLDDHLRIAFSAPPSTIAEGLHRLAVTWRRYDRSLNAVEIRAAKRRVDRLTRSTSS